MNFVGKKSRTTKVSATSWQAILLLVSLTLPLNSAGAAVEIETGKASETATEAGKAGQTPSSAEAAKSAFPVKSAESNETLQSSVQLTVDAPASLFNRLPISDQIEVAKNGKAKSLGKTATNTVASLANFMLDARGFDFSIEGADLVLGQHKLKGDSAKEFLTRVHYDKKELATIQTILQLAAALDKSEAQASKARTELIKLLGEEKATQVESEITALPNNDIPTDREKASWNLDDRKDKVAVILEKTAAQDPLLNKITARLEKYNHRSKTMQIMAKVVYTGCGIAAFAPTLAAPIAETTQLAFMYATGGPEQDKLLKELYLSKMMQSRCDLANEKAHMIIESRDLALLTNNKRLYAWSKELLSSMTNKDLAEEMYSNTSEAKASTDAKSNIEARNTAPSLNNSTTVSEADALPADTTGAGKNSTTAESTSSLLR